MFRLFAGVNGTGGIFAASLVPLAKFTAGVVDICGKFSTSIVDIIGSKFAAGVVGTGGEPSLVNIFVNFQKNSK